MREFIRHARNTVALCNSSIHTCSLLLRSLENLTQFPLSILFRLSLLSSSFLLFAREKKKKKKTIITSVLEHHSNFVPWLHLSSAHKIPLSVIPLNVEKSGIDMKKLEEEMNNGGNDIGLISLSHISNVLGSILDISKVVQLRNQYCPNAKLLLDACQSISHTKIDTSTFPFNNIDFMVFSSHKMYGPTGIGVLYVRDPSDLLAEDVYPWKFGGSMIGDVYATSSELPQDTNNNNANNYGGGDEQDNEVIKNQNVFTGGSFTLSPELSTRFEGGTPQISQAIGLGAACSYLQTKVGLTNLIEHETNLTSLLYKLLSLEIPNIIIHGPKFNEPRGSLVTFSIPNIHPQDLTTYLSTFHNISLRDGMHCCQPLHASLGVTSSLRVSVGVYNFEGEVEEVVKRIGEGVRFLLGED